MIYVATRCRYVIDVRYEGAVKNRELARKKATNNMNTLRVPNAE